MPLIIALRLASCGDAATADSDGAPRGCCATRLAGGGFDPIVQSDALEGFATLQESPDNELHVLREQSVWREGQRQRHN